MWYVPLKPRGKKPGLQYRSEEGYYVGPEEGTDASLFLTSRGVVPAHTFKRRPNSEKW